MYNCEPILHYLVCVLSMYLFSLCAFSITHFRYINILTWLRGFRVKIAKFLRLHCLAIPRRDSKTKKYQTKYRKMTRKPRNPIRLLIYRTWARVIRELKQPRRRPQRRLQKNNRFNDQNNSSARASRFLVHFFDVHCTTTTWNLLIWRFMGDVDIRRRIFLPLFEPE